MCLLSNFSLFHAHMPSSPNRSSQVLGVSGERNFLQSVIQMYAEGTLPHSLYLLSSDGVSAH